MTPTRIFTWALFAGTAVAASIVTESAFANNTYWLTQPGCLSQIQASSNYLFGIGCGGGNQSIFRMPISDVPLDDWYRYPAPAVAVQVSAGSDDIPWVINTAGQIFEWDTAAGTWAGISGCARSIAVGNDASHEVWVVGCTSTGSGNYVVRRWNGSSWSGMPGGGASISVEPGSAYPSLVTAQGTVYGWNGSSWVLDTTYPSCVRQVANYGQELIDCDGYVNIYQLQPGGGSWAWDQLAYPGASVTSGPDTYWWATSTGGDICYYDGTDEGNGWCGSNF